MANGFDLHGGQRAKAPLWPLALLLGAFALLYLATFPQNFTEGEDAVYYVDRIAAGNAWWHPNHLLFEPANAAFLRLLGALGLAVPTIVGMQWLSLLAGLVTLALVYRLAAQASGNALVATGAAAGLGLSFGFWLYTMYPDTYSLPLPFMVAGISLIFRQATLMQAGALPPLRLAIWGGIMVGMAVLFHQQQVFLALAGFAALVGFALTGAAPRAVALGRAVLFGASCAALVGFGYFLVGLAVLGQDSPLETILWSRGLAENGMWTPLSPASPLKGVVGLGTAIWSAMFLFAQPQLLAIIERLFAGRMLAEEIYFAQVGLGASFGVLAVLTLLSVLAFGALLWGALGAMMRGGGRVLPVRVRVLSVVLLAHISLSALAIILWEPANKEFWIAVLPSLFVLVFVNTPLCSLRRRLVAGVFLAGLLGANLLGAIQGFAQRDSDFWFVSNAYLIETPDEGDLIIDHCTFICTGYVALFSRAELFEYRDFLPMPDLPGQGRVFITQDALDAGYSPPGKLQKRDARLGRVVYELVR